MSLTTLFRNSLASTFGIDVVDIELVQDGITIAGALLPTPGTFNIGALLDSSNVVDQTAGRVTIDIKGRAVTIARVNLRPQSESGIIEIGSHDTWLFLGSFGTTVDKVDLENYPELLFSIACFDPLRSTSLNREWSAILEAWGPFVVSQGAPPEPALAEIGCFMPSTAPLPPEFLPSSQVRLFHPRPTTSTEALNAYILGLQSVDGPDVAFLRFYRIFELEFAATIRDAMNTAALSQVYATLRTLHGMTELEILKRTLNRSAVVFSQFTCDDFRALFGTDPPMREQYRKLATWLESGTVLPTECRALVIYYIRCALVHSKFTETERFLFGPFEGNRSIALAHVVSDMRAVLRDILAT